MVHVAKGALPGPYELDGKQVPLITAYLFHAGGHLDPARLPSNDGKCYQGCIVLGMGFTFDDTDKEGVANPISLMNDLIAKNNSNADRILPFIGGEELNDSPTHTHHRYIIDFFDMSLDEAEKTPELLEIVRTKVKPERDVQKRDALRERWWQYADKRPALRAATRNLARALANCQTGPHVSFAFLPTRMIYSHALNVYPIDTFLAFCALQSRVHELWARFFSSSMKDDVRYVPTDCFETFPFPENFESNAVLEAAGKAYYEFRAELMVRNKQGLTATYNRFHDPNETSADIRKLREMHAAMDRAVLDAYGWTDLQPTCDFYLDYEDDEDDEEEVGKRAKKKPYRYRWPDEFRDEVLARLLDLNRARAEAERAASEAEQPAAPPAKPKKAPRKKPPPPDSKPSLFD